MAKTFRTAVVIEGDSKGGVRAVRATESELKKLDRQTQRTERKTQRSTRSMRASYTSLAESVKTVGLAFGAFEAVDFVRGLVDANVAMQRINSTFEVVTGSSAAAAQEFDFVKQKSNELGLELRSTATQYAQLVAAAKGTNLQGEETRRIFTGVAEASTALHLSAEQTEGALNALQQMISKGNVQAEELRGQLGERLPGAFRLAAQAMGVTTQQLNKMLEQGQVTAQDMLPALARQLHETFGPQAAKASDNLSQSINRLHNAFFQIESSGDVDGLAHSIDGLTETLQDPDTQEGLQDFAQLVINVTTALTDSISQVGKFASAIQNLDYKNVADFIFQHTGPGYLANKMGYGSLFGSDDDAASPQAIASTNRTSALGILDYDTTSAAPEQDGPMIFRTGGHATQTTTAGRTSTTGSASTGATQSQAAQRIASLQKELALYGDLSNAEQVRISLANGYYGQVSDQQRTRLMQLAREMDAREAATQAQKRQTQAIADQADSIRESSAAFQDALAQQHQATTNVQQELLTPRERASQAMSRRAEVIRNSSLSESQQLKLLQKNWDQYAATVDDSTNQASAFARRAAENIQDQLGDTLEQTLSGNFDGILDSWGNLLKQMAAQAVAQNLGNQLFGQGFGQQGGKMGGLFGTIASGIGGLLGGGLFGGGASAANATSLADAGIGSTGATSGLTSAVGSLFGGFRAAGGDVSAGKSYVVGEHGPEIATFGQSGTIIPNEALRPAANQSVNLDVQIVNQGNGQIQEVGRSQSTGPNGRKQLRIMVRSELNDMARTGELNQPLSAYNTRRSTTL